MPESQPPSTAPGSAPASGPDAPAPAAAPSPAPVAPAPLPPPLVAVVGEIPFAGRAVVRALAELDIPVRVLCADEREELAVLSARAAPTPGAEPAAAPPARVETLRGSVESGDDLARLLDGAQGVVFLAPLGLEGRAWRPQTHLADLQRLLEHAERRQTGQIVYLSSVAADPKSPVRCLREAVEAEKSVAASRLKDSVLRATPLMGRGDRLLAPIVAECERASPFFAVRGYGDSPLQPLHVEDLGRCVARCFLEQPQPLRPGIYSVAGPDSLTWLELADRALGLAERFKLKVHLPLFAMKLALLPQGRRGQDAAERLALLAAPFFTERNDAPRLLGPAYRLKNLAYALSEFGLGGKKTGAEAGTQLDGLHTARQ